MRSTIDGQDEVGEDMSVGTDPEQVSSRNASWNHLPQNVRGITMRELWDLYENHKTWLEELRWRCDGCHLTFAQEQGPCQSCGHQSGQMRMRNLYEVNAEIIRPACEAGNMSYV